MYNSPKGIGVAEPPNEVYGKVMSITDSLILDYFELVTDVPDGQSGPDVARLL